MAGALRRRHAVSRKPASSLFDMPDGSRRSNLLGDAKPFQALTAIPTPAANPPGSGGVRRGFKNWVDSRHGTSYLSVG